MAKAEDLTLFYLSVYLVALFLTPGIRNGHRGSTCSNFKIRRGCLVHWVEEAHSYSCNPDSIRSDIGKKYEELGLLPATALTGWPSRGQWLPVWGPWMVRKTRKDVRMANAQAWRSESEGRGFETARSTSTKKVFLKNFNECTAGMCTYAYFSNCARPYNRKGGILYYPNLAPVYEKSAQRTPHTFIKNVFDDSPFQTIVSDTETKLKKLTHTHEGLFPNLSDLVC